MSKAQTDIRSTSYDALTANPQGYQGTIADALAQISTESISMDWAMSASRVRADLLRYLGVDKIPSAGPSVEMDENPRYGDEPSTEPSFYTLAYALKHFPDAFLHRDAVERVRALSESQLGVYRQYLMSHPSALADEALAVAEAYPYPAVQS